MNIIRIGCLITLSAISGVSFAVSNELDSYVVPVNWQRYDWNMSFNPELQLTAEILLNTAHYSAGWIVDTFQEDPSGKMYMLNKMEEHGVRPSAQAVYGLSVVLKMGIFDENSVGISRGELTSRAVKMLRGLCASHKVNSGSKGWGDHWQSALWSALAGHAGWLMWDDLDGQTRLMLCKMVEHEADRFIVPGYKVPYWDGKGGDTKAEENAWNTMILQLAVAMMPRHPNVDAWKLICSELMASAYSLKSDMSSDRLIDGKPLKEWLHGYNMREDGLVVNHNFPHPDYTAHIGLNLRSYVTQSLAGQCVPEAASLNCDFIYDTFVNHKFSSPPYRAPGGTIYVPGKAEVYYPNGNDWSYFRFDLYYMLDVFVHALGIDRDCVQKTEDWIRLRGQRLLEMQSRHADRRLYAPGEYDKSPNAQTFVAWQLADAFTIQWLKAQNALSEKGNWLEETVSKPLSETSRILLRQFRLLPDPSAEIEYLDLDGDGDPDVLRTTAGNGIPVQWIDDDDDMKAGDIVGDMDSDCLMVDINKDGQYGGFEDFMVDRDDENGDGRADIEVIADNATARDTGWPKGHFMIVIDTDGDGVFNYVDWKDFKLKCWEHSGLSHFYEDYLGKSMFLKVHTSTYNIRNLEYNWENPFLFYDPDKDGLSEMAIRLCDEVITHPADDAFSMPQDSRDVKDDMRRVEYAQKINWASLTFDLDNDTVPGNEFDFDMTLNFRGGGFTYEDQAHTFKSLRGLPDADKFFYDSRWRQITQLMYPDHDAAWNLVFDRGQWNECRFVFDEDDDCQRWERVELYEPLDAFKIGAGAGGIDNNSQSDESGDRGEWDSDNSGRGNLYLSKFDGRLHLYGAEWGCWRIDQDAQLFQGWSRTNRKPKAFPTIRYSDSDGNSFLDTIEYDLDGDRKFEQTISLGSLGIDDRCPIIETGKLNYSDLSELYKKMAESMWMRAMEAEKIAEKLGIATDGYALLKTPRSLREKYHFGYWLNFYIYTDLMYTAKRNKDKTLESDIIKAYFSGDWKWLNDASQTD